MPLVVCAVAVLTAGPASVASGQAPPTPPTTNLLQGLVEKLLPTTTAPATPAPAPGAAPAAPGPAGKAPPP
ncbi:MAG: hypothetical protein M3163_03110, partial [Actinomycetota bacterium]|nr:hypothetical protein [Actinomycetota bacterium]